MHSIWRLSNLKLNQFNDVSYWLWGKIVIQIKLDQIVQESQFHRSRKTFCSLVGDTGLISITVQKITAVKIALFRLHRSPLKNWISSCLVARKPMQSSMRSAKGLVPQYSQQGWAGQCFRKWLPTTSSTTIRPNYLTVQVLTVEYKIPTTQVLAHSTYMPGTNKIFSHWFYSYTCCPQAEAHRNLVQHTNGSTSPYRVTLICNILL